MVTNKDRVKWAKKGLRAYHEARGDAFMEEYESLIGDVVADLMHLADDLNLEFQYILGTAENHYNEEILEEEREKIYLKNNRETK